MIQRERRYLGYDGEEFVFDSKVTFLTECSAFFSTHLEASENGMDMVFNPPDYYDYPCSVSFIGTPEQVRSAVERFLSCTRRSPDGTKGCFVINGYKLYGTVIDITVTETYLTLWSADLTFRAKPVWTRETKLVTVNNTSFGIEDVQSPFYGSEKKYDYGYSYGYPNPNDRFTFDTESSFPVGFRLTIAGPWENPTVKVSGHIYTVNVNLARGEQLVIDSTMRRIYILSGGQSTDCFDKRSRDRDKQPFEMIPPRINTLEWTGRREFTLTLIEERDAAKWI